MSEFTDWLDELNEKEKCCTGPTEPQPRDPDAREAWRCDACGALIYNCDQIGRPFKGAPDPHFGNVDYQQVCKTCHDVLMVIDASDYWRGLHREWKEYLERHNKNIDGLTGREDYFSGA